ANVTPGSNTAPMLGSPGTFTLDEDSTIDISLGSLASDADSDPLIFTVASDPSHGWVAIDDNDTPNDLSDDFFVYSPDADYNGSDSFGFAARDIWGAGVSGTVSISVSSVNDDPRAEDD